MTFTVIPKEGLLKKFIDVGDGAVAEVVVLDGTSGLLPVDTLGSMGVSRLIALGATSVNLALTTTIRRISIHATVAGFFSVGTGAQTATTTSHYIGAGERLDFDVPASAQIAAIRASTDGTLYISELL